MSVLKNTLQQLRDDITKMQRWMQEHAERLDSALTALDSSDPGQSKSEHDGSQTAHLKKPMQSSLQTSNDDVPKPPVRLCGRCRCHRHHPLQHLVLLAQADWSNQQKMMMMQMTQ